MHKPFVPSPAELSLVEDIFLQFDAEGVKQLPSEVAFAIFQKSHLPPHVLARIWTLSDEDDVGYLTEDGLAIALRLIGWAQYGRKVNRDLLFEVGPLPVLDGIPLRSNKQTDILGRDQLPLSYQELEYTSTPSTSTVPATSRIGSRRVMTESASGESPTVFTTVGDDTVTNNLARRYDGRVLDAILTELDILCGSSTATALAESQRCRNRLVKISTELGIQNQLHICHAIARQESYSNEVIKQMLKTPQHMQDALLLDRDDMHLFLNLLDSSMVTGMCSGGQGDLLHNAKRLRYKLAVSCGKLPPSLLLNGVYNADTVAIAGGAFSEVHKAKFGDKDVALKKIRVFRNQDRDFLHKVLCKEALLWKELTHQHVLPFLGIDEMTFPGFICLVSPWMPHGTLLRHVIVTNPSEQGAIRLLYQVAQGVAYLHGNGIVHGDLRGGNILIDSAGNVRIADFGLATFLDATLTSRSRTAKGTLRWMAPELLFPDDLFKQTYASDVYAFACTCLEGFTAERPFSHLQHDVEILKEVVAGRRPSRPIGHGGRVMPDILWDLIETSWSEDPRDRPRMEDVCQIMDKWPTVFSSASILDTSMCNEGPDVTAPRPQTTSDTLGIVPDNLFVVASQISVDSHISSQPLIAYSGHGHADIYRGQLHHNEVALKRLRIYGYDNPRSDRKLLEELDVWRRLHHPNLQPILGMDKHFSPGFLCVVSPWTRFGNVLQYVKSMEPSTGDKLRFVKEVALGLSYLHKSGILHGNLRGNQILLDDKLSVKLADYGLAEVYDTMSLTASRSSPESLRWLAPELLNPQAFGFDTFTRTRATDIFAFACTCLEMFTLQPPFSDIASNPTAGMAVLRGLRPTRPNSIPDSLWAIIQSCWVTEPSARPPIDTVARIMEITDE